jgi:geranylgeranyl diphosphate synthase type II
LGNASDSEADSIGRYGQNVGLAFQIADDILDETGDSTVLGKTAGSDQEAEKATYPKVFGLDQSRSLAQALVDAALEELSGFGEGAEPVRSIAHFIVAREF